MSASRIVVNMLWMASVFILALGVNALVFGQDPTSIRSIFYAWVSVLGFTVGKIVMIQCDEKRDRGQPKEARDCSLTDDAWRDSFNKRLDAFLLRLDKDEADMAEVRRRNVRCGEFKEQP